MQTSGSVRDKPRKTQLFRLTFQPARHLGMNMTAVTERSTTSHVRAKEIRTVQNAWLSAPWHRPSQTQHLPLGVPRGNDVTPAPGKHKHATHPLCRLRFLPVRSTFFMPLQHSGFSLVGGQQPYPCAHAMIQSQLSTFVHTGLVNGSAFFLGEKNNHFPLQVIEIIPLGEYEKWQFLTF